MKVDDKNSELITVACTECGAPVNAETALLITVENQDGSVEVAVFHSGRDRMCPLKWAAKKLDAANAKLQLVLNNLDGAISAIRQNSGGRK